MDNQEVTNNFETQLGEMNYYFFSLGRWTIIVCVWGYMISFFYYWLMHLLELKARERVKDRLPGNIIWTWSSWDLLSGGNPLETPQKTPQSLTVKILGQMNGRDPPSWQESATGEIIFSCEYWLFTDTKKLYHGSGASGFFLWDF